MKFLSIIPCHRRPDRTIHIKGKPMPLCARCTAIYSAYLFLPFFYFVPQTWFVLYLSIIFQLPMFIDGLTQKLGMRESNNVLRVITGGLSGIGQCLFIWYVARVIIQVFK